MAKDSELTTGDEVWWRTHETTTHGTVDDKITSDNQPQSRDGR